MRQVFTFFRRHRHAAAPVVHAICPPPLTVGLIQEYVGRLHGMIEEKQKYETKHILSEHLPVGFAGRPKEHGVFDLPFAARDAALVKTAKSLGTKFALYAHPADSHKRGFGFILPRDQSQPSENDYIDNSKDVLVKFEALNPRFRSEYEQNLRQINYYHKYKLSITDGSTLESAIKKLNNFIEDLEVISSRHGKNPDQLLASENLEATPAGILKIVADNSRYAILTRISASAKTSQVALNAAAAFTQQL